MMSCFLISVRMGKYNGGINVIYALMALMPLMQHFFQKRRQNGGGGVT